MRKNINLQTPLTERQARRLKAGDEVLLSGTVYAARDMAHKRLCAAIRAGKKLPLALDGAVIYFVGPSPARRGRPIGSAGPTTAGRMDAFTPQLLRCGLRATIGKGYRSRAVRRALQDSGGVHLAAVGGAGALLSKHIVSAEVVAYEDLGPEAVRKLQLVDFPAFVAYDAEGRSIYPAEQKRGRA